ncbi:MAG: ribbon-helix-helix protein, CopG family [Nitrospirae bacterium]|nr:ribbon-helix-helix protein, CopG family [Nitrospirota bacterium]
MICVTKEGDKMSTTITIRIEEDTKERLNKLAKATDRT